MNLYLDIFIFIVDIRPGSEYPSDKRNKLFSYDCYYYYYYYYFIIISIIIFIIIIIKIDSGSIYKYNVSSPYKLKKCK